MTIKTYLTNKQYKILVVLCEGNGKDENGNLIPCDMDELLERIAYHTTKDSMQFSIRALIKNGLLVKDFSVRRGARRVVYVPTKLALQIMGYGSPSFLEDTDLSYLDV